MPLMRRAGPLGTMSLVNNFRFGVVATQSEPGNSWADLARNVEGLGYDILLVPDTVPETSTPSTTDSSRRSSSSADPSVTPRTSTPRWAGAGTDRESVRIDPGRRPSSRVSSTSGWR